jgi:Uma2 family endonuclease
MKVHTAQAFYYPDLMVVCDKSDTDPYTKSKPVVVVEIISANTRSIYGREKRLAYQGLRSLQEYVLAEQDRAEVRVLHRRNDKWQEEILGPDHLLRLPSLDVTISMQTIYEGVWR